MRRVLKRKRGQKKKKTACKATTYKHVISPFVSGRITVEVFRKAWLNMGAFILEMTNICSVADIKKLLSWQKNERSPYQLLKTFLPWVWLLILLWIDLVELPRLRVHHGPCIFENLHVKPLPGLGKKTQTFYEIAPSTLIIIRNNRVDLRISIVIVVVRIKYFWQ